MKAAAWMLLMRTERELVTVAEQGAQFKFNKKNKKHVNLLKEAAGNDELAIFPGGLISMGMKASPQIEAEKNSESKSATKAVAPKKSKMETKLSQSKVKKVPGFLAAARSLENESRKRGEITEGLKNPKDDK